MADSPPRKTRKTASGAVDSSFPPSQTLYIQNLNDKISKQELKTCLYHAFSTYGHIIDIVALKTCKMRGQAHIAFADPVGAGLALRAMQGFSMFGKQMKVSYAKEKSHSIARLDGTFRMPQKQPDKESTLPLAPFESGVDGKRLREDDY